MGSFPIKGNRSSGAQAIMDPLSISVALIALIGAANATLDRVLRFATSYRKADSQMKSLGQALQVFRVLLRTLEREDIASCLRDNGFADTTVKSTLTECKEVMDDIHYSISLCEKDHALWAAAGRKKVEKLLKKLFQYERKLIPLSQAVSL